MNSTFVRGLVLGLLLILGLSACTPTASPAPADVDSAAGEVASQLQPVCTELGGMLGTLFGVTAELVDPTSDPSVTGCQARIAATGDKFLVEPIGASRQLADLMAAAGWTEDQSLAADGPTGTVIGFRRDALLATLTVNWDPAADVECPSDQPISACNVPAEKRNYTITMDVSQSQ